MIREIALEKFKAFSKEQKINLRPITLIYGANSSGKSSILQSMMMLGQSDGVDRINTRGRFVDLGSLQNAVYNHNQEHFSAIPGHLTQTGGL